MSTAENTTLKWSRRGRSALAVSFVLLCAAGAYQAVSVARASSVYASRAERAALAASDTTQAVNPFLAFHGKNLIAYVIVASDCGWSNSPATMRAASEIRSQLRHIHSSQYAAVTVIGVAIDKEMKDGLDFLAKIEELSSEGAFDQVIIGGSWLNEELVRLLWREALVEGSTPQVLLIERQVGTDRYLQDWTLQLGPDRVVGNPSGTNQILAWLRDSLPLKPRAHVVDTLSVRAP